MADISTLPPPPPNLLSPQSPVAEEPSVERRASVSIDALPPPPASLQMSPEVAALPPPPQSPEYKKVQEIQNRPFLDAPLFGTEETTDKELEAIALEHNIPPQALKKAATLYGAVREKGQSPASEQIESSLGRGPGMNLPQFGAKKIAAKLPGMEEALDDVQKLADSKRSFARAAAENLIPTGLGAKLAGKALGVGVGAGEKLAAKELIKQGAKEGAVIGSAAGLGNSRKNEELQSTATGGVLGAGLGGAIPAVVDVGLGILKKLFSSGAPEAEQKAAEAVIKNTADLDQGTAEVLSKKQNSEQLLEQIALGKKLPELDENAARVIATEQVDPQLLQEAMGENNEASQLLRNKISRKSPEDVANLGLEKAIEKNLAQDVIDTRVRDFAEDLTGEKPENLAQARAMISEYSKVQGEEATAKKWQLAAQERAAMEFIDQKAIRAGRGDNFVDKALNFVSDAQFVLRDIDERFGTSLEPIHQKMNQYWNRMSFARNEFRDKLSKIYEKHKPLDANLLHGGEVYKALDSGDVSKLSPEELQAYHDFQDYFQHGLNYVNDIVRTRDPGISPMSIPANKNYVPHMLLPPEQLAAEFQTRLTKAVQDVRSLFPGKKLTSLADLNPREFNQAAAQSFDLRNLIAGLQTLDSQPIKNASELMARYQDTLGSREGRIKMATLAKAALERQGNIPEWMREKNLYKLADRWAGNTLKHLYLRRGMDEMGSLARRIQKAGGDLEAGYLERLLQDLNGVRKGTAAEASLQGKVKYLQAIDKAIEGRGAAGNAIGAVAKALPEVFSDLSRQIYPNLLGLSPRALLMNSTQLFAKTAPELGNRYGYSAILRSVPSVLLNYGKQMERIKKGGFSPAEFIRKFSRPMAEGIRRNSKYAIPNEVLSRMGDAAMFLYTKMDAMNRAITLSVADTMASDLAKGSKAARESLNKMPAAVRRAVNAARTPEEVSDIIAKHLNASTQYNYNRLSMSEFGRTMGPLFSVFSKWPTATAGELISEMRSGGLSKGSIRSAEKFLVPLVLLQLVDIGLTGYDPERPWQENQEEKSDRLMKLTGKYGMSQSAPVGAAGAILSGDFFTPPAIDSIMQGLIVPTLEASGDDHKLSQGLATVIQNFTPGSVFARFLTDDLLTILSGERPEGSNFLERTEEGIRRISE